MNRLHKGVCLLLLAVLASAASSEAARQPEQPSSDLWLNRARSLTDEIVKDSDALGVYDRALLWARLGKAWRQDDAGRARAWLEKAVQTVESDPDKEDAAERVRRVSAARSLLVVLGADDKDLSARLDKVVNAAAAASIPGGAEDAHARAEAALAVLDRDPQRALQLGLASLRAGGGSYKLASVIWRLRRRDVSASDALFMEVIAAARERGYDRSLLGILPAVAFEGPVPSDKLRGSFLDALAEGLLRPQTSEQEGAAACRLAPLAAPLLAEFHRLRPQQAGAVRVQIVACQSSLDAQARQEIGDALGDKSLKAVEDLLEAAGKSSDLDQRVAYLSRAAYTAFGEQRHDRAISILDGFSREERERANRTGNGLWDNWRSSFASAAAVAHLKLEDRPAMNQVVAATPAHLRASVQISVAAELAKKDRPAAAQMLDEARAALAKIGSPKDFDSRLSVVRLYAALNPADALSALAEAVKAMNHAEGSQQTEGEAADAEAQIPLLSNDQLLARYALPASLLAADDVGVRQVVASIASPARRSAVRLRLLGASLAQRRTAAPKAAAETKGRDNANP